MGEGLADRWNMIATSQTRVRERGAAQTKRKRHVGGLEGRVGPRTWGSNPAEPAAMAPRSGQGWMGAGTQASTEPARRRAQVNLSHTSRARAEATALSKHTDSCAPSPRRGDAERDEAKEVLTLKKKRQEA